MLCILPRTLVGWNSLGVTRSTIVHAPTLQQCDATLQQRNKFKEPPVGWSHSCARRGEPVVIKRGVKPRINEAELMGWIDEQCDKAMSPTTDEILQRVKHMAAPTMEGEAATFTSGLKWWRLFKNRNPALKERAAQMCASQRGDAKSTAEEWSGFFNDKLHPALLRVNMTAQHVYNQDESGYLRNFLVNLGKVWARKGRRWVARRRG